MNHSVNNTSQREDADKKPDTELPSHDDSPPRFPERHESNQERRGRTPVPIPDTQRDD